MAGEHERRVTTGEARKRASGFGGTGFKFDEEEELEVKKTKALWRRELESSAGIDDFVEEEEVGVVEEEEVAAPAPAAPTTMVGGLPMTAGGKLDTAAMVSAARQRAMEIERLLDKASGKTPSFQGEVEINDYPQQARFKVRVCVERLIQASSHVLPRSLRRCVTASSWALSTRCLAAA